MDSNNFSAADNFFIEIYKEAERQALKELEEEYLLIKSPKLPKFWKIKAKRLGYKDVDEMGMLEVIKSGQDLMNKNGEDND